MHKILAHIPNEVNKSGNTESTDGEARVVGSVMCVVIGFPELAQVEEEATDEDWSQSSEM